MTSGVEVKGGLQIRSFLGTVLIFFIAKKIIRAKNVLRCYIFD